jgi:hypothetical protein
VPDEVVGVVDEDARVTPSDEDAEAGLRVRRGRANATRPGSYPPAMVAYKTLVGGRIIIGGYPTTQPENKMQSTLLLDIIIRKRTSILKLLPSKNQTLLIRRNPLLVLDLRLDVVDRVGRLDFKRDGCEDVSQRMFQSGEGKEEG